MDETSGYRISIGTHRLRGLILDYVIHTLSPGILLIFKNRYPTSQRTHCFSVTKTSSLVFCRELIFVCSKNRTERVSSIGGRNTVFVMSHDMAHTAATET